MKRVSRPPRYWEAYRARREFGRMREARLVDVLRDFLSNGRHRPPWMQSAELGTDHQDFEGIDVVVKTDVGDLFIQVKSSERFKYLFVAKGRKQWKTGRAVPIVGIVIVNDGRTDRQILREALSEINRVRQIVQLQGSNYLPARKPA